MQEKRQDNDDDGSLITLTRLLLVILMAMMEWRDGIACSETMCLLHR
jgi:hypothetical protein